MHVASALSTRRCHLHSIHCTCLTLDVAPYVVSINSQQPFRNCATGNNAMDVNWAHITWSLGAMNACAYHAK